MGTCQEFAVRPPESGQMLGSDCSYTFALNPSDTTRNLTEAVNSPYASTE